MYLCSDEQQRVKLEIDQQSCDLRSIPITIGMYLCSDEQHTCSWYYRTHGCDLLSKNCIFVLTNNNVWSWKSTNRVVICVQSRSLSGCIFVLTNNKFKFINVQFFVVICFQKIVSLFWRTTTFTNHFFIPKLWFAFKKLYLCSDEQLELNKWLKWQSCDLLSKNCIFVLTNNFLA